MVFEIILACLGSSGLFEVIKIILDKFGKRHDRIDSLVRAQKVIMIDRVEWLARRYITEGKISLRDKENLEEMYASYKGLGGNGDLDPVMVEIRKLKVVA